MKSSLIRRTLPLTTAAGERYPRTGRQRGRADATLGELGEGDFLHLKSLCGHDELIPPTGLLQGWRLPPYTRVLDLERRFRCRGCDRRGKVMLSIRWA